MCGCSKNATKLVLAPDELCTDFLLITLFLLAININTPYLKLKTYKVVLSNWYNLKNIRGVVYR